MTTKPLCWSNKDWLRDQIEYACLQFHHADKEHTELREFWLNRWSRLERHYKDLRGV
jgi:hypothetical protein